MPLQKRRLGKGRIHHRRSAWMRSQIDANTPTISTCSNCSAQKLPHRVCETCGHYGGKAVIEVAAENLEE